MREKKRLKSELFMLILCIVCNNWNFVGVIILNINLLYFIDMADVMSHGGDAGGDPPPPHGKSRIPSQCESCKY